MAGPLHSPSRSGDHEPGPGAAARELDVLGSLRTHWRVSCRIFLAAAVVFVALALMKSQRTYTSTAALHVARTFPRTLQEDSELDLNSSYDYDAFRNDQVALILRPDVLNDALRRCGQAGPPWGPAGAPDNLLAESFARAITVQAVPKSSRIEIALKSGHPETLQPALEALLAAFQDAHRREYFFTQDERPETLRTALLEVEASIAAKRQVISLMELLTPLAARHAQLKADLTGLGEGHPGRAATLRQLGEIEEQVRDAGVGILQAGSGPGLVQQELAALAAPNADLQAFVQRGRILEEELPRDLSLRDRLKERLEFFEFEAQSPSFAEVSQPASVVDLRGESSRRRNLAIAVFLALMLAAGAPVLWDRFDPRVHTPGDLSRALGFTAAGWLPGAEAEAPPGLRASQVQRIAQSLERDRKRSGARLLVFAGVTSLPVLDLLRELALALQSLGRKVLVVDAAGADAGAAPAGPGLLSVLAGGAMKTEALDGAVRFLPYGDAGRAPPCWDAWSHKLAAATQDFDLVLVAAPALLSAPASELLVTEADLAVLVAEAEHQSLGEVDRAGQLLRALRPKALGALLTNVKPAHRLIEAADRPGVLPA